jgi:hypothetical protein
MAEGGGKSLIEAVRFLYGIGDSGDAGAVPEAEEDLSVTEEEGVQE